MIPVRRGEEPQTLRDERWWRLARAILRHLDGEPPSEAQLTGYGCAKEALLRAQGNKCSYCEMRMREGCDVEHFRAKSHYWWLTWSWNNLFVACSTCNNAAHKGARFELVDSSARLQPMEEPPGNERPLLLDPADPAENPVRKIEFRRVAGRWQPVARAGDRRGQATIETFGLDRGPILDHYQDHIEDVQERIRGVHEAIEGGDRDLVSARWKALIGNAFSRTQEFQGLMYDVLSSEFPAPVRREWGLPLREPGADLPQDPPVRDRHVPAHASLPRALSFRVRALGDRPEAAERDAVIVDLCAHHPSTCAELAATLERGEGYIGRVLKYLVTAGRLTVEGARYAPPPARAPAI